MDRLAMVASGFDPVVSVPNGAPAPGAKIGAKLDFLDSCEEVFASAKQVIIATDNDEPGRTLANELVRRIGSERCYRVQWPDGCKDANDVLIQHGARGVADLLDSARPEPISGIITGDELTERLIDLYHNDADTGIGFGYPHFDQIYRVKSGMLTIVTGHSSHGKSTAFDQLLVRLVEQAGWHIAIFSPEQVPLEKHQAQIIEQYSGLPVRDGPARRKMSQDELLDAHEWVSKHFTYILPEQPTIDEILEKAKVLIFRRGIQGLVIDPWNEIEHDRPHGTNDTEYINQALQRLRNFARVNDVHLWLIAHPTKMPNTDNGEEQIPKLQNISGSVHFRNKADFGLTVFRDLVTQPDEVDIIVTKSRWMDYAKPGRVRFAYDKVNKRLYEKGPVV
jgi:twinkle protein